MPIVFSYDLTNAESLDHNRIRSMFERFGWENIGGSCYRYPRLARITKAKKASSVGREDWLNAVLPALMCFRSYVLKRKLRIGKHSLDAQTSTGSHGAQLKSGAKLALKKPKQAAFGEKALRKWVDGTVTALPPHY